MHVTPNTFYPVLTSRRAIVVSSIALFAYIAFSLFRFDAFLSASTSSSILTHNFAAESFPSDTIETVIQQSWFGVAPQIASTASGTDSALAGFELHGVSQSDFTHYSGAYISEKGGTDSFYQRGDILPAGTGTLKEIFADHVVINNQGTLETLAFAGNSQKEKDASAQPAEKSPFYALPPEKKFTAGPVMSPTEIAKRFITDPAGMLAKAGLEPVTKGNAKGYLFNGNDEQGVFADSGVQKNDIIMAVNDNKVGDPKGDRSLVPQLALQHTLKLEIQRSGQRIIIDYTIP